MLLKRLSHAFAHLRKGTLLERLYWGWCQHLQRQRLVWWESQATKLKNLEVEIQPGIRMRLYFDSQLSRLIYCQDFEKQERQFLNAFLKPGDIFMDFGANIGLFTVIAAHRLGSLGRVYAFEPYSKTYERLLDNIKLNRLVNISCYQVVLSDYAAQLSLNVSLNGYDAWNSLAQPIAGSSFASEAVKAVTWDDFALEHDLVGKVTMVKIDVEGWESRVLLGGSRTLSRTDAPVLQVEFTEQASRSAGSSCTKLYRLLESFGYQMFIYDSRSNTLKHETLRESYPYLYLIATKCPECILARLRAYSPRRLSS